VRTISRDAFQMTVATPDAQGVLKALAGVQVSVYKRDTTNPMPVYQKHDGTAQGPTAESGASGGPNPFLTGASGSVEFWCNGPDEIDIAILDTVAPARIAPRTVGWNAMTSAPGSLSGDLLAPDASIDLTNMAADVLRQMTQIGEVIDWWRPADSVPIPSGFEVCDGHQVPAGQHDFPGLAAAAINLPDLRNAMILGADPTKARLTGANQGNAPTDAPGIAGSGGSNAAKDLRHGHGVPGVDHLHHVQVPDHLHSPGSLYAANHKHTVSINSGSSITDSATRATGNFFVPNTAHYHVVFGSTEFGGNQAIGGATGAADRALGVNSGVADRSLNTATNSLTWTTDPGSGGAIVDMRPKFVGLLKLMKVRRS
jgi:hypothetical protein